MASLVLAVAACAGHATRPPGDAAAESKPAPASNQALNAPMGKLALTRREIPQVLLDVVAAPYGAAPARACVELAAEVRGLDEALGPDADVEPPSGDRDDLGWRLFAGGVKSFVPYFGWMRRLSGAERRDREAFAAREAGIIRRAYLKGVGEASGCGEPASPRRAAD